MLGCAWLIACGGAGTLEHVVEVIEKGKADAVSLASLLHYHYIKQTVAETTADGSEGNTEFLRRRVGFGKIADASLAELKRHLQEHHIDCRWNKAS